MSHIVLDSSATTSDDLNHGGLVINSDSVFLGFIILAVWWFASAFAVGIAAGARGQSSGRWVWTSLFFGPILAALLLLAYPVTDAISEDGLRQGLSITARS